MFQEALLESSRDMRRRNAWPMATAFTLQMAIGSALILVPLISTGILPLTTKVSYPMVLPTQYVQPIPVQTSVAPSTSSGPTFQRSSVVPLLPSSGHIIDWNAKSQTDQEPVGPWQPGTTLGDKGGIPGGLFPTVQPPPKPASHPIISNLSEAMILSKVVPEYPNIARLAGVQGDVKLHAIIAKDGTIQSLSVTSGPNMLREAALKAVQQWRYRPYILNGEAVEVETFITVSFHRF